MVSSGGRPDFLSSLEALSVSATRYWLKFRVRHVGPDGRRPEDARGEAAKRQRGAATPTPEGADEDEDEDEEDALSRGPCASTPESAARSKGSKDWRASTPESAARSKGRLPKVEGAPTPQETARGKVEGIGNMKVEEASEDADEDASEDAEEDEDDPLTMLVGKVTAPKPESAAVGMEGAPKGTSGSRAVLGR